MSKSSLPVLTRAEAVACCSPLTHQPLSAEQAEQVAPLLKALADPVRLRLMSLVASHDGGEACVCDLADAFDLSQPTISHHLKVLHDTGLLERQKRGVWVYYRARTDALAQLGALIGSPATVRTADASTRTVGATVRTVGASGAGR
jgi:ArsR family transcriptional regulator